MVYAGVVGIYASNLFIALLEVRGSEVEVFLSHLDRFGGMMIAARYYLFFPNRFTLHVVDIRKTVFNISHTLDYMDKSTNDMLTCNNINSSLEQI